MKLLVVLLLVPALARAESADIAIYKARANDSFGLIAAEYYGDRTKAPFIAVENRNIKARPIRQYERIRVPVIREIITAPGDTFQTLARDQLGDPGRGGYLAETNDMSPDASLPAGIPIHIPFVVTYTADNKETLASIAATYYGDAKHADVLKRFNSLDKAFIEKADSIKIPSWGIQMHPARLPKLDPAARQRRETREKTVKLAATAIPAARHAWRVGDYARVRSELQHLETAFLNLDQAVEVEVLLGSALVSFNKTAEAQDVFKQLLERKPGHVLRRVNHSPKVLAVWEKADGKIE